MLFKAGRKSTLVFCVNLAHVRDLTNAFRGLGVDARYLHAGTPVVERKALITSFRAGAYPVLINCGTSRNVCARNPLLTVVISSNPD